MARWLCQDLRYLAKVDGLLHTGEVNVSNAVIRRPCSGELEFVKSPLFTFRQPRQELSSKLPSPSQFVPELLVGVESVCKDLGIPM